jgi:pimeloyl-ACP methyl ester carboxylesterase
MDGPVESRACRVELGPGQVQLAATLLLDLLTPAEAERDARDGALRFAIPLLGERLVGSLDWVGRQADLAPAALALVRCPVLLIVGDRDTEVLRLNRWAAARLRAPHRISLVAGASHLFEEPGTLACVADQASDWFSRHLAPLQAGIASHFHTQP